jgi:hypothetical protein
MNLKTKKMNAITDKRKFKRKVEQSNPTNPSGNTNIDTNKFDIEADTIRDQQNKK